MGYNLSDYSAFILPEFCRILLLDYGLILCRADKEAEFPTKQYYVVNFIENQAVCHSQNFKVINNKVDDALLQRTLFKL